VITDTNFGLETIELFVSDMEASRLFYENTLGLRALALNPDAAMYSAGYVQLCLLQVANHVVPDRSVNITFMVDDLQRCRDVLAARGVRFSRTLEYVVGLTANFYDPDGHWFSLYQPSEAAMKWPSGRKLEAFASDLRSRPSKRDDLSDAFIAYVFLVFHDPDVATGFYGGVLGFEVIEGGPCQPVPTRVEIGVVKYDVGTTMLATYHLERNNKRDRIATVVTDGVAMQFRVADLTTTVADLSRRGIAFSDWSAESATGRLARFKDPAGHILVLQERSGMSANAAAQN
jgi:catechol 2,3-dioxygenase-like lactoylglutathione lyase family enzyme